MTIMQRLQRGGSKGDVEPVNEEVPVAEASRQELDWKYRIHERLLKVWTSRRGGRGQARPDTRDRSA
jgi:hypothetical protein